VYLSARRGAPAGTKFFERERMVTGLRAVNIAASLQPVGLIYFIGLIIPERR
jgi:hypothetical protein